MSLIQEIKRALKTEEILSDDHWIFDEPWTIPNSYNSTAASPNSHSRVSSAMETAPRNNNEHSGNTSGQAAPLNSQQEALKTFKENLASSNSKRKGLADITIAKPKTENIEETLKIQSAKTIEEFHHLLFEHPWYKAQQQSTPHSNKVNILTGQGPLQPQLMIINLQPYPDDIQLGYPFSGAPGELLKKMLKAIGVEKNLSYQTFLDHGISSKKLLPRDRVFLFEILKKEIELVQPKAILLFSEELAQTALKVRNLETVISQELSLLGIPTVATYPLHWMLHDEGWKRPAWTTLQTLKSILER